MGNIQRGYFMLSKLEHLPDGEKVAQGHFAHYGDFLFNTRNTLELVGKGATWIGESKKYAFNSNIARFEMRGIDTFFFNYLYNTDEMIKQIHSRAMGTTSVAAIYPRSLKSILYYAPPIDEQYAIGKLLLKLDSLIALHQRKHGKLKTVKQSLLEKMFPKEGEDVPEIRFEGFTEPWEQRKLEEVATFGGGHTPSMADPCNYENGSIPWITSQDVKSQRLDKTTTLITDKGAAELNLYPVGSLVVVVRSGILRHTLPVAELQKPMTVNQDIRVIVPTEALSSHWLLGYLEGNSRNLLLKFGKVGTTVESINFSEMKSMGLMMPSREEQSRIGSLFAKLDSLIALHQRELEILKNLKKAMLEKMFV